MPRAITVVASIALAIGGCSEAMQPSGDAGASDGGGLVVPPPTWVSCPLHTEDPASRMVECATLRVPAFWDEHARGTIELFIKRVPSQLPATRQLWMLEGGPGGPGALFEGWAETISSLDPELEIYIPDHRGVGHSTRLTCSAEDDASPSGFGITSDEWPGCIAEVSARDDLDGFTTTMAARDVAELIDRTRRSGVAVHMLGVSYGTYWAQRYVALRPNDLDSLTLLGVVPPDFTFARYDSDYDRVARAFLVQCGRDSFCQSKLGADPVASAERILAALETGHCAEAQALGFTRANVTRAFAPVLMTFWGERAFVPALLYRLDRCAPEDLAALTYYAQLLSTLTEPGPVARLYSRVLGAHIAISEMWHAPFPTLAEADAQQASAIARATSTYEKIRLADLWPVYQADAHVGRLSDTSIPILIVQGGLDPATPLDRMLPVVEHYDGPSQHFLPIAEGSHAMHSPTATGSDCAHERFMAFLRDPSAPVASCEGEILPMDFRGTPALAAAIFGAADLYEGGPVATSATPAAARFRAQFAAHLQRALERAEQIPPSAR